MESLLDLQDALQRELAWRKREISDIRAVAMKPDESPACILRGSLVLLCAHWEGFLKKSAKLYIRHVFSQDVRLRDLTPNLVAIAYFTDVSKAAEAKFPGSQDHHIRLASRILNSIDERPGDPTWDVDTEGNPGSDVLKRVLSSIGLDLQLGMDAASWGTTKVFINEQLVRDRHSIAHGEGLPISKENLLERAERLLALLDVLSERILDHASTKAYQNAA